MNPKDVVGANKPNLSLVPQSANILEAVVMSLGATKYGSSYNWRHSPVKASVYVSAALRHLAQWNDGEDDDAESGVSHLAHARACLGILIDAQTVGSWIDDRPEAGASSLLIKKYTLQPLSGDDDSGDDLRDGGISLDLVPRPVVAADSDS